MGIFLFSAWHVDMNLAISIVILQFHYHVDSLYLPDTPSSISTSRLMLTHWGRDKMATIFQTTSSNVFSSLKMFEFRLKFHWNLFLRVQSTISQHWFRWWLGADQATSHHLNQWWLICWCIYASLGLNELSKDRKVPQAHHTSVPSDGAC